MLIGLKRALRPGDRVPATLHFASGGAMKVVFDVSAGGPPSPANHMSGMSGMGDMH
jgi:copper(I)-binding protein